MMSQMTEKTVEMVARVVALHPVQVVVQVVALEIVMTVVPQIVGTDAIAGRNESKLI